MSDLTLETTLTANAGPLNAALQAAGKGVDQFSAEAVAASKAQTAATQANTAAVSELAAAMQRIKTAGAEAAATQRSLSAAEKQAAEDRVASATSSKAQLAATQANTAALTELVAAMQRVKVVTAEAGAATRTLSETEKKSAADKRKTLQDEQKVHRESTAEANRLREAYRQLPMQITDVTTSLVTGMPIWMVAIQQGGQVRDAFGGIGPALRGVLSLLTPMRLALGGGALALGTFAIAAKQGYNEVSTLNKQFALLGPTSTHSSVSVLRSSEVIASSLRVPIGAVREMATEMVRMGGPGVQAFEEATRAGVALQRLTGQSATEVAQQLQGLSSGVTAWAMKANAAYGFLTAAQFDQVRSLEAQGRTVEATRMVLRELAETMEQRTGPAMTWLDRQIEEHNAIWSRLRDTLKGFGRETSAEDRLAALQQRVQDLNSNTPLAHEGFVNRYKSALLSLLPGSAQQEFLDGLRSQAEAEARGHRGAMDRTKLNAAERAAAAKTEQAEIERMSAAHQAALSAIDKAGAAQRLAADTVALANRQAATEMAFQRADVTAQQHQSEMLRIDLARIDAQDRHFKRLRDIEAARKPMSEVESLQQQAAVAQIDAQRTALAERRVKLLSEEARGMRDIAPKVLSSDPRDALRAMKADDERAVDEALRDRKSESLKTQAELVAANKAGAAAMIRDDRARGLAQIAMEEEQLRRRLDLAAMNAEDRRRAEEELATWRMQREYELTEQLKPEWERRLEAWNDTNRLMRDSYDSLMDGLLTHGERTFSELLRTGRVDTKALVSFVTDELAKMMYRQHLAPAVKAGGNWLADLLGIGMAAWGGLSVDPNGYGIGSTRTDGVVGLPTRGGAATGSNFVERDMLTIIHEGEAVIPREFNPWGAGTRDLPGNSGQQVIQNITYHVPPGQSPAAYAAALAQNNRQLKGEIAADMMRPGRPMQRAAAQARF